MGPVVEVGEKNQPVARPPGEIDAALGAGPGAEQGVRAVPRGFRDSGCDVHHPERPGARMAFEQGLRRAALARLRHQRDALSVRRPHRRPDPVGVRGEPADRRGGRSVEAEQAVAAPGGDEPERSTVGRPGEVAAPAPGEEERLGLAVRRERHRPDLSVSGKGDPIAPRADGRLVALSDCAATAAGPRRGPDLDPGPGRAARGVGLDPAGRRPVPAMVAAAHEDELLAVRREGELGQVLAVVVGERGELFRGPRGALGGPDVADSFFVLNPRDSLAGGRADQVSGEREGDEPVDRPRVRLREEARHEQQECGGHCPHGSAMHLDLGVGVRE